MAFRPNYTPAGFDDLLAQQPQPMAVPQFIQSRNVAAPPQAYEGSAPGGIGPGDEYDQRLAELQAQQKLDQENYSTNAENIPQQLALQKQIDDLQAHLASYPAEREKAFQEYLANAQAGSLPAGSGGTAGGGGVDAQGNPVGVPEGTGVDARTQGFVEPWDSVGGQTQLDALTKQLSDMQTAFATGRTALTQQQQDYYSRVADTVKQLRANADQQRAIDSANSQRIAQYQNQIDPYNQSVDAYNNYAGDLGSWQAEEAQRQADLDAGKYKVDPFAYLRGGRTMQEILDLRKQINAGNMNPNMDVPTLRAAPTAVNRPGDAPQAPQLEANAADVNVSDDVAKALQYKKPESKGVTFTPPKRVAEVTAAPAPVVAPTPDNPDAKPTPIKNPGSQGAMAPPSPTTQQKPAASPTIQQHQVAAPSPNAPAPAAPLNASTSLPQQTTGSVSGQAPAAASTDKSAQSQPTPNGLINPSPFKDPDKEDPNKDKQWEL